MISTAKEPGAEPPTDVPVVPDPRPSATVGAPLSVPDCERCGLPIIGGPATFRLDVPMTGTQTLLLCSACLQSVQKWARSGQTRPVASDATTQTRRHDDDNEPGKGDGNNDAKASPSIPYAGEPETPGRHRRRSRHRSRRPRDRNSDEFNRDEKGRESVAVLVTIGWTLALMSLCVVLMVLVGLSRSGR